MGREVPWRREWSVFGKLRSGVDAGNVGTRDRSKRRGGRWEVLGAKEREGGFRGEKEDGSGGGRASGLSHRKKGMGS